MFYLEIWIRKGGEEFGCLKLNERYKDKIRYENSIFFTQTLRKIYYRHHSLEYEKHNSRWTLALRYEPSNSYTMYRSRSYHFETSGQSLGGHLTNNMK